VGILLAISIFFTELALWSIHPIDYQSELVWQPDGHIRGRYVPNQSFRTGPGHNPLLPIRHEIVTNHINRYGFRGPDYSLLKAENTVRVAVFGGSSTFNYHDAEEKSWPKLLEACLSKGSQHNIQVINLALPGFHMGISKINYLENGRAFSPEIAIAYHTWNDLKAMASISQDATRAMFAGVASNPGIVRQFLISLSRYSQIVRHLRIAYYTIHEKYREGRPIGSTWQPSEFSRRWFAQNFRDFVHFAQMDGVVPVLSSQGSLISAKETKYVDYDLIKLDPFSLAREHVWATNSIAQIAKDEDAVFVDVYSEAPHTIQFFEDAVHITPEGQELVAQIFCHTMLRDDRILKILSGTG